MPDQVRRRVYTFEQWQIDLDRRELRSDNRPVPLGGRAFEINEALISSAGEPVTKDELMARIWPGAMVEENTLQVHISAVRRAFGEDRRLLKTASGRGYRLMGQWKIQDAVPADHPAPAAAPPAAEQRFRSNFPLPMSDLVGRGVAMQQLRDLVSTYRLVTLTGPGGIGKTTLALAAARDLLPALQGDGWLIELATLSDPNLVCSTVAGVLGLQLSTNGTSPASIARAVGGRRGLLVLDKCEHLIDAVADLAETMLHMCLQVTILATSLEMLGVRRGSELPSSTAGCGGARATKSSRSFAAKCRTAFYDAGEVIAVRWC